MYRQQTIPRGPHLPCQPGGNRVEAGQAETKDCEPGSCQKPEPTVATCQDHSNRPHARSSDPSPRPSASTRVLVLPALACPLPQPPSLSFPFSLHPAAPRLLGLPTFRSSHPYTSSTALTLPLSLYTFARSTLFAWKNVCSSF